MAVIDFDNSTPANVRSGNANRRPFANLPGVQQEQPESQIWMNFGYYIHNANGESVFINLPNGVAIDTMRLADTRGSNEDFVKQRHASNDLLKQMQMLGAQLAPGEVKNVIEHHVGNTTWVVQLRRVKGEMQIRHADNEYAVNLSSLFQAAAE